MATNPILIALLALPHLNHFLILKGPSFLSQIKLILVLTSIIAVPVIYGIYLETIKNNNVSLMAISKKYIINFTVVAILIHLPLAVLSFTRGFLGYGFYPAVFLLSAGIEVVTIYVMPFVYLTGFIIKSITAGTLFTLSKAKENTDLVTLTILAATLAFLSGGVMFFLLKGTSTFASAISFAAGYASSYLSCLVFVAACMRLKEITIEV